jgi:hypothetical protein
VSDVPAIPHPAPRVPCSGPGCTERRTPLHAPTASVGPSSARDGCCPTPPASVPRPPYLGTPIDYPAGRPVKSTSTLDRPPRPFA